MSHLAALEDEVREAVANAAKGAPPELTYTLFRQFGDSGYRYGYEHPYFERRGRLVAAAAAALFDVRRDGAVGAELLAFLTDELWRVCDEYTWALPAHADHARDDDMRRCVDLFAAETAHTVADLIARFGKQLPEDVVMRCREELMDRVFIPFADDQRPMRWESMTHNWLAVCAGGVGMAALAFFPDDAKRLQMVLKRSQKSLKRYIEHFPNDGGCSEGMDYWIYGFGYYVYAAEAWRERGGPDLLDDPKVREIAAFPAKVGFADGSFPNFSDGSEDAAIPTGLISRLAERLGAPVPYMAEVPSFASDFCHRWAHLARTIEWTDPMVLGRPVEVGASYLPDLGWAVDRSGDFEFAAKAGHNDELHNHLDVGHFILRAYGETLLADLGAGEYTGQYFGESRYLDIHTAADGHSVPIIDGQTQSPGREFAGQVLQFGHTNQGTVFDLDMRSAYELKPGIRRFTRSFDWRAPCLLIVDEVHPEPMRDVSVEEVLISRLRPHVEEDAVVWEGQRASVRLSLVGLDGVPVVEPIETTGHRGEPETVYRLRLRAVESAPWVKIVLSFEITAKEQQ